MVYLVALGIGVVTGCSPKPTPTGVRRQGIDGPPLFDRKNGDWVVPWKTITDHIATLAELPNGDKNHRLLPDPKNGLPVYAEIFAYRQNTDAGTYVSDLEQGIIIARIHVSGAYPRLNLLKGDNYFGVFQTKFLGKHWHPMMLHPASDSRQKGGKFTYTPPTSGGFNGTGFTKGAWQCKYQEKLAACFVDNPEFHIEPVPPAASPGPMGSLWIRLTRLLRTNPDESQPWVSCPEAGCCCGGTNCHPGGQ
jgi:hypothetical protein